MVLFVKKNRRRPSEANKASGSFTYYSSNGNINETTTQRQSTKTQRGKRILRHVPSFVAGLSILVSLLYVLSIDSNAKLNLVQPTTPAVSIIRPINDYQKVINTLLNDSILSRSKLTINTLKLEAKIKSQFPEIDSVNISLPLSRRRPTVFLHAKELGLLMSSSNENYAVDKNGIVVLSAKNMPKILDLNLPKIVDQSGLKVSVGKQFLTADEVNFINLVAYELAAEKVSVESMVLVPQPAELDIKLSTLAYVVKFNLGGDGRVEVGTFLALKTRLDIDHVVPSQYIDVRIEEKAYYK